MRIDQLKNQHLLWRAGFGPASDRLDEIRSRSSKKIFHEILEASRKSPDLFDVADPSIKTRVLGTGESDLHRSSLSAEELKNFRKQSVLDIRKLNIRWIDEMTNSSAQLREKMALFWHGHFATKTVNIIYDQQLLNIIRQQALGNFRDLLFSVSRSASMIRFLNNNQNRKDHPNENFARELMELFTMGRGNYTERDVKESARAFTGWNTNLQGDFETRERQHDNGTKEFLGKTGNLSGDDILDTLLGKRETSLFITRKIYRFLVNDQADETRVNTLADTFFRSGYDIEQLMIEIFTSSWFYDQKNIGVQIKSPVEWIVGIRRQLGLEIENPEAQILIQRLLGQVLFNPPNVAGWPGGKHWIDSSSLMFRLRMPQIIYDSDVISLRPKDDDDLMMGMSSFPELNQHRVRRTAGNMDQLQRGQFIKIKVDWDGLTKNFQHMREEELLDGIAALFLQTRTNITDNDLRKFLDTTGRDSLIRSAIIRYMSTPAYQLC